MLVLLHDSLKNIFASRQCLQQCVLFMRALVSATCCVIDGHLTLGRIKAAIVYAVVTFSSLYHWRGDLSPSPTARKLEIPRVVSLFQASTSQSILWFEWKRSSTSSHLKESITSLFLIVKVWIQTELQNNGPLRRTNLLQHSKPGSRISVQYSLSLDVNFAPILADNFSWPKKSSTAPQRGLTSDGEDVPTSRQGTANQKNVHLELMLGQIANFCPAISRNTIVKNSTSVKSIWQAIRAHYGFQSTGAHFLDFSSIKVVPWSNFYPLIF